MATMIIKPYVDKEKDTIGLSDLGMNSFPRTSTTTEAVSYTHLTLPTIYSV